MEGGHKNVVYKNKVFYPSQYAVFFLNKTLISSEATAEKHLYNMEFRALSLSFKISDIHENFFQETWFNLTWSKDVYLSETFWPFSVWIYNSFKASNHSYIKLIAQKLLYRILINICCQLHYKKFIINHNILKHLLVAECS